MNIARSINSELRITTYFESDGKSLTIDDVEEVFFGDGVVISGYVTIMRNIPSPKC